MASLWAVVGGGGLALTTYVLNPSIAIRPDGTLVDSSSVGVTADGADGDLKGASVPVNSHLPAVARLDPALLDALHAAAAAASNDGVKLRVTSGWRSHAFQERLLDRAVERYGSREEANRWVADPENSSHVTGSAVDIGPTDAAYWMAQHAEEFDLCQTYANEIWHYELRDADRDDCPPMRPDGSP